MAEPLAWQWFGSIEVSVAYQSDNLCNRIIAIKDGKIVTNDTIENFKKDVKNNVSYELKLNSLDKIEKFIFDYKFELLKDNIIKVYISKENISNLIKKLIENGYQIYSVQEVKISSEEAFFSACLFFFQARDFFSFLGLSSSLGSTLDTLSI